MSAQETNSRTIHSSKDFTMLQNKLIRSSELSCKAFKLLCIGLSHSGKWNFIKKQIATCFKEGEYTLDGAMKELRDLGYLHLAAKKREDNKFTGHNWFWFENPISEEEFKIFSGQGGFHGVGESGDSDGSTGIRKQSSKNTKSDKNIEKDNVPPQKEKKKKPSQVKDFSKALNLQQKEAYDKIMRYKPQWGEPVESKDVCAWMLAKKYSPERLLEAFSVYKQDVDDAIKKGRSVDNMGGSICTILKGDRKLRNRDYEINREMAERKAKQFSFLKITRDYVTGLHDNIMFNLPHMTFLTALESTISVGRTYTA